MIRSFWTWWGIHFSIPKISAAKPLCACSGDSSGHLRKQLCILTTYGRKGWQSAVEACCARLLEDFSGNNAVSWMMDQFNLTFRPIFDAEGGRLIRPPSLGFWWGRIQKKLLQVSPLKSPFPCAAHALAWTGAALDWLWPPPPASLPLPEFRRRIDAMLVRASCRCCARQALKPVALCCDPPRC